MKPLTSAMEAWIEEALAHDRGYPQRSGYATIEDYWAAYAVWRAVRLELERRQPQ